MNTTTKTETTALATTAQGAVSEAGRTQSSELILDARAMDSMMAMANLMASGRCTIPQHLQKSPADCMAVVMQSMQWGMNPFAVAQKTHVTQGGALGYEAQLISAVICAKAPVKEEAPEYEYIGDWSKVLGKVEERKSDKGGKYYVATYSKADEAGLGVICSMTLRGETTPRRTTLMMSQCYPRFSTQWATDPKQQISYAAIRKWARLFSPGTILGVYVPEELQEAPENRFMGNADVVTTTVDVSPYLVGVRNTKTDAEAHAYWKEHNGKFAKQLDDHQSFKDAVVAHRKAMKSAPPITIDQDTGEVSGKAATAPATEQAAAKTFDEIMAMLCAAKTIDQLYVAGDWVLSIADAEEQGILNAKFDEIKVKLEGGAK